MFARFRLVIRIGDSEGKIGERLHACCVRYSVFENSEDVASCFADVKVSDKMNDFIALHGLLSFALNGAPCAARRDDHAARLRCGP